MRELRRRGAGPAGPRPPLLAAALLGTCAAARPPPHRRCGILGGQPPQCGDEGATLQSNCTSASDLAGLCPEECPFAARHPRLTCSFKCATAPQCFLFNQELALPNESTGICDPCSILGCRLCSQNGTCLQCVPNFAPDAGGRACIYDMELHMRQGTLTALRLLGTLAILFVCAALLALAVVRYFAEWMGFFPNEGVDEDEAADEADPQRGVQRSCTRDLSPQRRKDRQNSLLSSSLMYAAIQQAMWHRKACKIKDLDFHQTAAAGTQSPGPGSLKIPFWVNLQERFLAGVGLLLYHSWFPFLILYSLLMAGGAWWVYQGAELSGVLQRTALQRAPRALLQALVGGGASVEDDSMTRCAGVASEDPLQSGQAMRDFAYRAAVGYLVLWLLGLALSLAHAARQRRLAAYFWKMHPSMSDFALAVEGFPPEATDEQAIRAYLRSALNCQTLQVSVCYDYRAQRDRVYELLNKLVVQADVRYGTYHMGMTAEGECGLSEAERVEVRGWLAPGSPLRLRNAGCVFVVFGCMGDLPKADRHSDGKCGEAPVWTFAEPLQWPGEDGKLHALTVRDVISEPPDVVWDHIGMPKREVAFRGLVGLMALLLCVAVIFVVVFMPFADYTVQYFQEVGRRPSDWVMSISGLLVMSANWIMCFVLWCVASRVGFERTDRQDQVVFFAFAVMCGGNFLFNVVTMVFPDGLGDMLEPIGEGGAGMRHFSVQLEASIQLFSLLVPGGLFVGYLMWPLQGFAWPLVSTRTYYTWREGFKRAAKWYDNKRATLQTRRSASKLLESRLSARQAERALEPLGISLAHDYMGHVVQPASCCLALFFASGVVYEVFLCLALWSAFMIPFQRYMHLRACKRGFFTTTHLDAQVLRAWGLPLSMVLSASAYWAARLQGWPVLKVALLAWACGYLLYLLLLGESCTRQALPKALRVGAASDVSATYEEVAAKRLYNWHNCNPMKVLLSNCQEEGHDPELVPFDIGKGYLQVEEEFLSMRDLHSTRMSPRMTETDYNVPEIEALLDKPYTAAAGALRCICNNRDDSPTHSEGWGRIPDDLPCNISRVFDADPNLWERSPKGASPKGASGRSSSPKKGGA